MMDFENTLRVLRVVGSLPPGCRLGHSAGSTLFVSRPSLADSARRTLAGESRVRTCSTIGTILTASGERLQDMERARGVDDPDDTVEKQELRQRAGQLHEALGSCLRGVESLRATYATDASVLAHLDVLSSKCRHLVSRAGDLVRVLGRQGLAYGL
ncbi:hypothetical protein WJX74_007170 [Apatococcus lobatus]|uniref:Uncharacterized protein n=1 Tax=Apatococcus lobatus TaxID=904363 RepID=A0AAW1R0Y2_9CHLO